MTATYPASSVANLIFSLVHSRQKEKGNKKKQGEN
jgi:hypothetical protein